MMGVVDPNRIASVGADVLLPCGMLLGQLNSKLPVWLTPLWVISMGLLLGIILLVVLLALLSALSFTPIGKIADSPRAGRIASLGLGSVISATLLATLLRQGGENRQMLILPLVTLGLMLGFAVIYGAWHRTWRELVEIAKEGVVPYILGTAGAFAALGLLGTFVVQNPGEILGSVRQVNLVGEGADVVTLALQAAPADVQNPDDIPFQKVELDYNLFNVAELTIESDKTITIADGGKPADFVQTPVRVNAGEPIRYLRENRDIPPLPLDPASVYMQNREVDPATVKLSFVTRPTVPEAISIPIVAAGFFLFLLGYVTLRQAAPRLSAVAHATAKSEMSQPLYKLLLLIGVFGILLFGILPFNTLGEDIRLMKDSCVTLIMVLGMVQAVWSAGQSVSDEIEGKTALTVLSKPISRGAFLIGKYVGIMLTVLVLFAILTAIFMVVLSYKPIYDARESSNEMPGWQISHEELMTSLPALALYFMETMAIGGIAVALATRVPLLANFVICFVIYVIGNLTAPIVRSTVGENELVGFFGKLIAVVIPNLNTFNVQSAVDAGNPIPPIYLAGAFTYLFFFSVMILMLALLMFEERDLA